MTAGRADWVARVRAGVVALLGHLQDEPDVASSLVADPASNGPSTGYEGHGLTGVLTELLEEGCPAPRGELASPNALTSELVVGGACAVIAARLRDDTDTSSLVELAPSLMSFIVTPFLGQLAAREELTGRPSGVESERAGGVAPIRATRRTTLVLRAIDSAPGSSNREIAEAAGLRDEGQTSKLLSRLERSGIVENVGLGAAYGERNAWLLTAAGQKIAELNAHEPTPPPRRRGAHRGEAGRVA